MKHAYQHLMVNILLLPGRFGGLYIGAVDDQKAYERQYYFSPSSVNFLNYDVGKIKSSKDILIDFIKKNKIYNPSNGLLEPLYENLKEYDLRVPGVKKQYYES